jgi:hypothetical protein
MVNLEQLAAHGLRAYELGRLRTASRVALALVPAAVVCLLEPKGRESCACLAVLLVGLTVWLRWRDRSGFEAATTGLLAGSLPLVAGLVLSRFDLHCGDIERAPLCTALSALVGVAGGVVIAVREVRERGRFASVAAAATISVLAASLGCLRLGIASVLSVALGIAVGAGIGLLREKRP